MAGDKAVVLLSGGMDSVTALYHTRQTHKVLYALGFDYGSKHNQKELPLARMHCEKLGVEFRTVQLPFINELFSSALLQSGEAVPDGHYEESIMKKTVVPFRNGIMLSIAAGFAESKEAHSLVIAAHSGDHAIYPDCRSGFMDAMAEAVRLGTYAGIRIDRPFIDMNKADIAKRGSELEVDFSKTWSCYKGGDIHCGTCGTCVERREAFLQAGVPDPTAYQQTPAIPESPPHQ